MSKIDEITRENWIMSTFPEWGTWLNEEIENEEVKPGTVAMWWLGCTGMWFKTPGGCNITVDLWCGNGKRSHGDGKMKVGHQICSKFKFFFHCALSLHCCTSYARVSPIRRIDSVTRRLKSSATLSAVSCTSL